jgi:NAD(P)-dependent dehydrogenase (short-subunit alcohol dehydrogenase family)
MGTIRRESKTFNFFNVMESKQAMQSNYVIIGGSGGIGLGLVRQLADAGNRVTVFSRSLGPLADLPQVVHFEFDAVSDEFPTQFLPESVNGFAYCPGSINLRSFRSTKAETFREDFELNVMGAVKTIQAVYPRLKASGQGSVLLFSTVAVAQGMPMHSSVAVAKGAIEGLTRTLAAEFAPEVRVNCLAPALTNTPLAARFFSDEMKIQAMSERYPLKRCGTVDDLAAAGEFLLTPASSWLTGQVIHIDGGMSTIK